MRSNQEYKLLPLRAIDTAISSFARSKKTWNSIRKYYNYLDYEVNKYDLDIKPVATIYVDPNEINKITGREYKPWDNKNFLIGLVKSGNWDIEEMKNGPAYPKQLSEWVTARSFESHFNNGVKWENTDKYREYRKSGRSHKETLQILMKYDDIVHKIKKEGYRSQKEMYLNYQGKTSVWSAIIDEVTVDIGRNGELLFVDGRHRLLAAQLLDLDSIPVTVLVRHQQWVEN